MRCEFGQGGEEIKAAPSAPAPLAPGAAEAFAELDRLIDLAPGEQARRLAGLRRTRPDLHAHLLALLEADAGAEAGAFLRDQIGRAHV